MPNFRVRVVTVLNVHNHLRGWKTKWLDILKAKDLLGAGWDEELKMIILDRDTHEDLLKMKSKMDPWVNVPIKYYDILKIVCGDDHARGDLARDTFSHWDPPEYVDVDDPNSPATNRGKSSATNANNSSGTKRHRSATEGREDTMSKLIYNVNIMANAINRGFTAAPSEKLSFVERLGSILFVVQGFHPDLLMAAYDYLVDNELEATKFIGLLEMFRIHWLHKFQEK